MTNDMTREPTDRIEAAQQNLELGLANDPRTATPLEASVAKMALTEMYSHRGDGIPTQYTHGLVVAEHARTMWAALLTALRTPPVSREAVLEEAARVAEYRGPFGDAAYQDAPTIAAAIRALSPTEPVVDEGEELR